MTVLALSRPTAAGLALVLAALAAVPSRADREPRVGVAKNLSGAGALLAHESSAHAWRFLPADATVFSRDSLVALPGLRAELEPRPESVRLALWGNLPGMSSFPGLECAVVLHDSRAFDLDLTLLRGRAVVTNKKAKGPAHVWVRFDEDAAELTLDEPGASVALEAYGRWPRGVPFVRDSKPEHQPLTSVNFLVLEGQADIKMGGVQHHLSAPPGPAYFHWDSAGGPDSGPTRRNRIPPWADPDAPAPPGAVTRAVQAYRDAAARSGVAEALATVLADAERAKGEDARRLAQLAVVGLAATGDLERVAAILDDARYPAARPAAMLALRHWIGEAAGNDQALYRVLQDRRGYSKAEAETLLQLLHSPFAADVPETYETLIAYLQHRRLAIRELAWAQLEGLVSSDVALPYDPAGTDEERARTVAAWKKLIPPGNLPPQGKK